MSALNTFFNGQTARNTAATARATGQIASAGRRWELQQRGWITPASTPAEIGAVEAILAAQMRARVELQNGRSWPFQKVAVVGGLAIGFMMLFAFGTAMDPKAARGAPVGAFLVARRRGDRGYRCARGPAPRRTAKRRTRAGRRSRRGLPVVSQTGAAHP